MKGGSRESIKKNHLITAVAASFQNIEQIIATGPANWWVGEQEEGQKSSAFQFDAEDEVVDFQMIMDQESNEMKLEESASEGEDDASSTTKEYIIDDRAKENNAMWGWGQRSGRKTMSLDQSLFPSDEAAKFNQNCAAPPNFSCSPIAVQSSQPEPNCSPMPTIGENDGEQAATASGLRGALTGIAPESEPNSANIQPEEAPNAQRSSRKKQRTLISTPSDISSLGKKPPSEQKSRRGARVSFQQQPRVMLLNPSWTLSNAHTRCLRKCANDGFISMLKMHSNDAIENEDQFDSGFEFDTKEGRELFLTTLSSDRTGNCPPAPLSFFAVSTEKDTGFSFGEEAIIIPRSFPYYLAVACGLPIVDVEFLSSAATRKKRGTTNHQRYLFPSPPGADDKARDIKRNKSQNDHLVLGATNYSWGAPQKARTAALDRHALWQKGEGAHAQSETLLPGTDLLDGYSVMLVGEFDQPNHSKRTVAKRRKQRDSEIKGGGYCTRGNISLLLQLCSANVYDVDSVATQRHIKKGLSANHWTEIMSARPLGALENGSSFEDALQSSVEEEGSDSNSIIVMVKDKSDSKLATEFLNQMSSVDPSMAKGKVSKIPVVSCEWLLDSIGEFEVKSTSEYENSGMK
eukprot:CAMPEP_0172575762 /NCGR_PEP_ID=MMETSP1067-20121228/137373_1 /TAXON_ID=265564 ORGANISM="Thalassiosira punctigera, Strain Tpunct2005C2" /NCGR_SAMPLE_ID=MMETSP1067 /ASSEMBLY_ACC=CAM_ASM_000444 /LENGTH=630 /DNA_ID=CAMNT_0013368413 /DNA_START=450 /DNA_END=2342 /DNA_ORIENTATION=+